MSVHAGGPDLFESYEQDYKALAQDISKFIHTLIPSATGDAKSQNAKTAQREIEEADEILGQMEIEVFNTPFSVRNRLQSRLRTYRTDLDQFKRDLKKAAAGYDRDRQELFGDRAGTSAGAGGRGPGDAGSPSEFDSASMDQRTRLLAGTERLNDSSRRLQDSHVLALETESVGAGILADLRTQREQIIRTRDTLMEADGHIDKASRTIKTMARRMATNRMITAAVIIFLVCLILVVLYLKLSR
ncbi:Vesicle transport V-snare protein [Tieghemiomyces parasiticus]|uniref:Vesicle transport V-snare protein n=1 Tax=Tieghemiomyces parasiticus TaxID=78921 RepID=A0A9W8ACQ7_9FUNG|nr:Vesicle transport V-snare protein [Tieghemiomyces parasiticus]